MAARTNTVLFASPPPAGVISRVASVVVTPAGSTTPNPVVTLDYVANPTASFPANDGDGYSITAVDSDSAGPSPASNVLAGIVAAPASPPVAPVIVGVLSV